MPRGQVTEQIWRSKTAYPGTSRRFWLYVPAQYQPDVKANLLVVHDGLRYLAPPVNAPVVLDNLIADRRIPPTIAVFVMPGAPGPGTPVWGGNDNRSVEYDTIDDRYATFLVDELLAPIERTYAITHDPTRRALGGLSSGGLCAFTVAWHRPDMFGGVISHCGSFVDIRGGHTYPSLIRRTERKPLRVHLQSGAHDLDTIFGSWPLANQSMAAALTYRGYDHQFDMGYGGHNLAHAAATLPDTLRWLWTR